jgi:LmbE family N-acetylglucosaminyl deacetylase
VTVLVVAAHPDDEVLGCGGTIAAHSGRGDRVSLLVLGEGITSRSTGGAGPALTELKERARCAAEILGITELFFRDFPDNRFDSVALLDLVKAVEEVKQRVSPDIVYTHHWGDLNVDHRLTCDAVLAAFRPLPGERVREIWAFEVPSATAWGPPSGASAFVPGCFVDISATLDQKIAAMKAYRGEIRDYPHPRSPEALRALAEYRGAQTGVNAAEAMALIRMIRE